jgi:hypothetical protein
MPLKSLEPELTFHLSGILPRSGRGRWVRFGRRFGSLFLRRFASLVDRHFMSLWTTLYTSRQTSVSMQ